MKKSTFAVVLLSMALLTMPAYANYTCQGLVNFVNVYSNGQVTVTVPGQSPQIYLCSLTANFGNGWTPESCKAAYAILLTAKLSGQHVAMEFNDNFTCSSPEVGTQGTGAYAVYIP